jgi:hypothetical protein
MNEIALVGNSIRIFDNAKYVAGVKPVLPMLILIAALCLGSKATTRGA